MATTTRSTHPRFPTAQGSRPRRALAALFAAIACTLPAAASTAHVGNLDVVTRPDGRTLPTYDKDGRRWIVGTPGQEYALRVCNTTGGRVLAVMSVDGVNVVSGDTASPSQSGYVLAPYECADINGWRKNLSAIAAFYFTELPDAYATRTGRPANVGVIGVAFFRERREPVAWREPKAKIAGERGGPPATRQEAAGSAAAESHAAAAPEARDSFDAPAPAPALLGKIGTGHGRRESSYVQTTQFEREGAVPNQTVAIHYDRFENLVAMGILPPPAMARSANPFPAWTPRFVPDPPQR